MFAFPINWNEFDNVNKYIFYFILIIACFHFAVFKKWRLQAKKYSWTKQFPSPWLRLPLFGNVHLCWGHPTNVAAMFTEQTKKLGHIWTFWKFGKPDIIVADHEIAKQILLSSNVDKNSDYDTVVSSVLGRNSLITSPGVQWAHDRRYLQKAFHYDFFNEVLRISNDEGVSLISKINEKVKKGTIITDVDKIFTECIAKITIRSQSKDRGKLSSSHYNEILHCLDIGRKLTHIYMYLGFLKHSMIGWVTRADKLEAEFKRMSSTAVSNIAKSSTPDSGIINDSTKPDLWSLVFNPTKPFSWTKDQVVTLVSAATDTTSISIIMTLFYLATHPECLDKAIEEVDLVCSESSSIDKLTLNELSKLKYLEMCWKEAMRLHSPIPMVGRNLRERVKLPDGRYLPPGADVYIMLTEIHRNPNLFRKPDKFIPERFEEPNIQQILPGSYIPFSYGPRNCIGLKVATIEAKLILAHVLWNFTVSTYQKPKDIKSVHMISSYPYPAIVLDFQPRRT